MPSDQPSTPDQPVEQIRRFVACVWEPADIIEIRRIDQDRHVQQSWCRAVGIAGMLPQLLRENTAGRNVYAGANPRPKIGAAGDNCIKLARVVFADFDHVDPAEALTIIRSKGLPDPTLLISSGHGCHAYWRLTEPMTDLTAWSRIMKNLVSHLGSDPKACNPERVMRLPGFLNCKEEPAVPCRILQADPARRYDLGVLLQAIPERPHVNAADATSNVERVPVPDAGLSAIARAASYIDKMGPAVQGEHGDDHTFKVACTLVKDFGLSESDAWPLLLKWNTSCQPPWGEAGLRRKLSSAIKNGKHAEGQKLAEPRENGQALPSRPKPRGAATGSDSDLPEVLLPGGAVSISETAETLGALLAETGHVYMRGGAVVTVEYDDDGAPALCPIKPASLPSLFESVARLMKWKAIQGGEPEKAPTTCSEQQAKLILHAKPFIDALPPVRVVSRCPVLTEQNGKLVVVVGYDRNSGILAAGQPAPAVALNTAKELLYESLADFNFVTEADRARALAEIITPALVFGGLLKGRAPVDLGEADNSQSGKGFRNRLTTAIYRHVPKTITQKKTGVGSLEESFNTALIRGSTFIAFDNVRGKVDSPAVESFLTEPTYSARSPYMADVEIDPARVVVMFTSNSAEITRDLSNRCCATRIRKQAPYYTFSQFPEGDILDHIRANQPLYLGAVFAVVRAWHAAGRQRSQETRHDFRAWVQTLDWICQNLLGTGPIMDGHRETQQRMTNPTLAWLRDVALAVVRAGKSGKWLRTNNLLDILVMQSDAAVPGLREEDDPEDTDTHKRVLQLMGRRLSKCFESDTLTLDGIQIDRRDRQDDQYRPIKEYQFTRLDPAIPAIPRIASQPSNVFQGTSTTATANNGTISGYSGVGGQRQPAGPTGAWNVTRQDSTREPYPLSQSRLRPGDADE